MLRKQLINLMENVKGYENLYWRQDNGNVVICLEETWFDYEDEPMELMELLKDYCYEWYNSVEIEVYM
jgi:hypothetical protein